MSQLSDKQHQFARMIPQLLAFSFSQGYEVTILECKRSQKQADENALLGAGIRNSLHLVSLAIDLALFKNGIYLTKVEDYQLIGEYWESIGGSWGGRFHNIDADHFSLAHDGRK